jgi:hypothetical protein
MAIVKLPNEIFTTGTIVGLIYGQPGVGKTTCALSAPDPVLIDADNGLKRVNKRFQCPSVPLKDYREFMELLNSDELAPFKTIVFDTLGKLVDMMGDYVATLAPANKQANGALTQKGYGALKVEFQRMLRLVKQRGKHLIFVAHEREEKDGDTKIIRPDVSGSSGKDLVKDLDFMGYMEMYGDKRTISFSPTEKYYAKNSIGLTQRLEVPDPDVVGNSFVQKHVIEAYAARLAEDQLENQKYDALLANLYSLIDSVSDAKTADIALATVNAAPVMWDSSRQAKSRLATKTKALGLSYDKASAKFVAPAAATEAAQTTIVAQQAGTAAVITVPPATAEQVQPAAAAAAQPDKVAV